MYSYTIIMARARARGLGIGLKSCTFPLLSSGGCTDFSNKYVPSIAVGKSCEWC